MSDRDIGNWEARLADQVSRKWNNYERFRIYLDNAKVSDFLGIAGEFLIVEQVSSESAAAAIALNLNSNDQIDLTKGTVIKTVFHSFYVTSNAQADEWIDIVVGINFEYYKQWQGGGGSEAQAAIIITNASADTNTVGASHICNRVLIRAHSTNGGLVWVDFGTAAVDGSCYELTAGDAMSVPLSNTNRINALFKTANDKITIIYEV